MVLLQLTIGNIIKQP